MNKLESWLELSPATDFSIYNLPYGIFSTRLRTPRAGIAIGEQIIDLHRLHKAGFLKGINLPEGIFNHPSLNPFIRLGKNITSKVRLRVQQLLLKETRDLQDNTGFIEDVFLQQKSATLHMPVEVPNYTDFYSSKEHATNVGKMFRDPDNALLPNWLHMPVGYHGRASSIQVSGKPVIRPKGQLMPPGAENPVFGPTRRLDFELEMAFVLSKDSNLGQPVDVAKAEDYIFGLVLFNDWSARDIQKWEYVPLGPFLGKNFASSISPWIVTIEALEYFKVEAQPREKEVLEYLKEEGKGLYDIDLEVYIAPEGGEATKVCASNMKHLYWSIRQQLAHQTVNGCNVQVGDMYASGTISGDKEDSFGSMLELSWNASKELKLSDGSVRSFIEDGDTVIMKGHASKNGVRVGFGEVRCQVMPSVNYE